MQLLFMNRILLAALCVAGYENWNFLLGGYEDLASQGDSASQQDSAIPDLGQGDEHAIREHGAGESPGDDTKSQAMDVGEHVGLKAESEELVLEPLFSGVESGDSSESGGSGGESNEGLEAPEEGVGATQDAAARDEVAAADEISTVYQAGVEAHSASPHSPNLEGAVNKIVSRKLRNLFSAFADVAEENF